MGLKEFAISHLSILLESQARKRHSKNIWTTFFEVGKGEYDARYTRMLLHSLCNITIAQSKVTNDPAKG